MKAVFFVEKENYGTAKNKVYGDDVVSKQSITIKEAASVDMKGEGYYFLINGDEDSLKKAEELLADSAKKVEGADKEKVEKIISEQEDNASAGFGAIFG